MSKENTLDILISKAIDEEINAQQFYLKALGREVDDQTRHFLEELVEDEKRHEMMLRNLREVEIYDKDLTIDSSLLEEIRSKYMISELAWSDSITMESVLDMAQKREYKAVQFFSKMSELPIHPEIQTLFLKMKEEEEGHHREIENRFLALRGELGNELG
ncbi:MAG: ferritin family protein [Bdellovibrionales bacterium]|nr:ferritin family protein [Bdellovibrionales bacterium]MBT3526243.1 ferritin family protein [Bdellovibrionales bacterium]MBT7669159.1 ferritin family protein [Bdellovibrionales bacterium]MBT7765612.1 ferritin family protein [Bdellovibrionales bacterium]